VNPAPKPDPNEVLRMMAEDAKAEAEMDRILGMSDEDVERELVAEGFDLEKVRADATAMPETIAARVAKEREQEAAAKAKADATGKPEAPKPEAASQKAAKGEEDEQDGEAVAPVVELAFYRRRKYLLIAAAVATLALAGVGAALALRGDIPFLREENTQPSPREKTPEQKRAALLREEARAACELKDAATCAAKLDEARALDPGGEKAAGVVETRRMLERIPANPWQNEKVPGP
jgi:hypothetical protein